MGTPLNRPSVLDAFSSTGQPSAASSSAAACCEAGMATPSRYVLLKDLDAAIKHLDDQQLDKLVSAALQERTRRRGPVAPDKRQRNAEVDSSSLPQGKLNAVRAAFKAGVTAARIAREFGISRSDVQRALGYRFRHPIFTAILFCFLLAHCAGKRGREAQAIGLSCRRRVATSQNE